LKFFDFSAEVVEIGQFKSQFYVLFFHSKASFPPNMHAESIFFSSQIKTVICSSQPEYIDPL
jgi:hypothetical protein